MFKDAVVEGFKNIVRSIWLSLTAISVLTVSLGIITLVVAFAISTNFIAKAVDSKAVVSISFVQNTAEESISQLAEDLRSKPFVMLVKNFTSEQVKAEAIAKNANLGNGIVELLEKEKSDYLGSRLEITPTDSSFYKEILNYLDKYANITNPDSILTARSKQNVPDFLAKLNQASLFGGIGAVVLFSLISTLVTVNIIRITIYSRKTEIEIMRLVGATNLYIRLPFIMEAGIYSIIASFMILLVALPLFVFAYPVIYNSIFKAYYPDYNQIFTYLVAGIVASIVGFCIITVAASWKATERYLSL
jgi:cell division transport system permease protein